MKNIRPISVLQAAILCAALLVAGGCGLFQSKRLEPGGPYAASPQHAALPELQVFDSAFDLVWSSLNTAFTYERNNRNALWVISPDIKRGLDKIRDEAWGASVDYATARTEYLKNPVAGNLDALQTAVGKLQALNATALTIIQKKGL